MKPDDILASPERLAAIGASDLLDSGAIPALDRVVRTAARLFDAPVAQINVVTADRQIPVSFAGPAGWGEEVELDRSLCQHVVRTREPLVIDDAREHPLVRASAAPLASSIVAYLSVPLTSSLAADPIASLCVVDRRPRAWTDHDVAALTDLAGWAQSEIEMRATDRQARVQAAAALRSAEARLRLALVAANLGDWELDLRTHRSPARSARHDQIFGYDEPVDEWSYARFVEHVHPDDRADVDRVFRSALERGDTWEFECRIIRADAETRWIWWRAGIDRDPDGVAARAHGVVMDVTERKRADAEREQLTRQVEIERERLHQIFTHAPALMSVTRGPDHVFELINPPYQQLIGDRQVIGKPLREALPEVVARGYVEMRDELFRTGRTHVQKEAPVRIDLDGDGEEEEHFVNFVTQPLRNADGEVDGMLTFAVDVTEQVRARRMLEENSAELQAQTAVLQSQARQLKEFQSELEASNDGLLRANREAEEAKAVLEAFFDSAPVAAAHLDRDLRYRRMNPALASIDGVDHTSVVGKTVAEVLPHTAPALEPLYRQVLTTGEPIRGLEITVPHPTEPGALGHFLVNYFPIRLRGSEPIGVGLVALDVTEQRRSAEREQVFSQLMEESRSEIYLFDGDTLRFVRVNRGARENLGYSMEELRSLTALDLKPHLTAEEFTVLSEPLRLGTRDVVRFETVHRRKDGSHYPVDVHLQLSPATDPPLFVALILDITERKRALADRERLYEAERRARERIQILADAGTLLSSSLDPRRTLEQLARFVVPSIADWCFVEVPTDQGRVEPVIVFHRDPDQTEAARSAMKRFPIDPSSAHGTAKVLRTGEPELISEIPEELLEAVAQDAEHLELLQRVGFRSHVSVPLRVRDCVLGVLSLVQAESGRRFSADDLPFVEELAHKAALALDIGQLFAEANTARLRAEREAERLERLGRLAAALNEAATMDDVARVCVVHGMDALGAAAGSLAVLVDDGATFEVVRTHGYEAEVEERWQRFPLIRGRPMSDAVLNDAPVLVSSLDDWRQRYPDMAGDAVRGELLAYAGIPLVLGDRRLGGLSFSFTEQRPFSASDQAFLANVGAQAAQALERARLLETEREARGEAEEANRAKAEFLSSMSHELRTPLNAIGGYVELLEMGLHGPVTEAQAAALYRVRRAQEVLLSLINDVLNFARIEAGRLEIVREPVDVRPVIETLGDLIAPQLRAKELTYSYDVGGATRPALADAERIRQILINLLTNAVKFTDPGGSITLTAETRSDHVAIRVSDTGRGIPKNKLKTIFDPFVQIDRQRTAESQQGVGLGLAISRELARAMGGDITVDSTVGAGTAFTLVLPATSDHLG